ncbi:DNA alkylation repair protein [Paenibacillus eucommiae]|uniref:3-methyladenine DNA glycosylase AlkD n=1 Tax=Paenibacillus eucommiae TaxID=1355755 RepID=A0ABS4IRS0_9BACL|nr:DNA alkylation repair protein [Paenibacillus eucommiae]MBP1990262.1 3-methyladenine DNA glycosylase AlkD [Paenibacillus eucommiae]
MLVIQPVHPYTIKLESWLRQYADPVKAVAMQAYMRDQFAFLGIKSPDRVALAKQFWKENGVPDGNELSVVVKELWRLPEREYQYIAMAMLEKQRKRRERADIELLEEIIVEKSWWDTVDFVASQLVGFHFTLFPDLVAAYAERWISSGHMWLQRTAILFQLGYKQRTDTELLFDYIRRMAGEKDFFIRKAIGWALREYSKTNEEAVREFVATSNQLSPLSIKEALKHINAQSSKCE